MESKLKLVNIKKENISNCYIMCSNDFYLQNLSVRLLKRVIDLRYEELNFNVFDEENFEINLFLSTCLQLPFSTDKRMVVLKNIKLNKFEELKKYLENPNPTTLLLILDDANVFTNLKNVIYLQNEFSNSEQQNLIFNKLKKQNKKITLEACKNLILKCDNNLSKLNNELTKLVNFVQQDTIEESHIDELVKADEEFEVFSLLSFLSQKQKDKAFLQIKKMLESKQDLNSILALIYSNVRRMFLVKTSSLSDQELSIKLGIKPYAVTKARQNSSNFQAIVLKKILYLCQDLDYKIKMGELPLLNAFYLLIFNILK